MGYPIAGVQEEGAGAAEAEKPIEFYLASADPAKGQQVFNKCMACHNADKGGANQLGPNLWDIVGEPIAQGKGGFAFSDALKKVGGTWNWDNLSKWLDSPQGVRSGHQDDLRRAQQPAGPRRRHRLPEPAQRFAAAAAQGAGGSRAGGGRQGAAAPAPTTARKRPRPSRSSPAGRTERRRRGRAQASALGLTPAARAGRAPAPGGPRSNW